ncbi:MAG: ribonuclease Z [Bacteroidetes bacterium]|nr:ribonuclease Z [Bacteroidota bacterium]
METTSNFSITILGNSAAIPTKNSHLSSQVVVNHNNYYLIDCGEGTQLQLIRYKIKYHKIDNIFISHLHGDHFFGLIGLLSTYHLLGREKPLNIYGPPALKLLIEMQLKVVQTKLKYELLFHELDNDNYNPIFENKDISVYSFPLVHRVPTWGFKFEQKQKKLNIKKSFVELFNPSIEEILNIKNGENFVCKDGAIIPNNEITTPPQQPLSYAYCSDTRYDISIMKYIIDVSVLYHEATFDSSMQDKAHEKFHSTARDAANMAKNANATKLILGHFSARNKELTSLLAEACVIFENTIISEEGIEYLIS